jgi:hypothetical protein
VTGSRSGEKCDLCSVPLPVVGCALRRKGPWSLYVIVRRRNLATRHQLLVPEPMPMIYNDILGIGIGYRGYNDVPYALAECVCQPRCTPQVAWPLQHRRAVILVKFSKHHLISRSRKRGTCRELQTTKVRRSRGECWLEGEG